MSAVTAVATVAVSSAETAALPSAVRVMSSIIAPVVSPIVTASVAGVLEHCIEPVAVRITDEDDLLGLGFCHPEACFGGDP